MTIALSLHGVSKSYRDATRTVEVLRGVDLEIEAGARIAIVGPSGSGKSTLLHLLGGLDRPDAGEIEVGAHSLGRLTARELAEFRNRTIGFVFQFQQLLADFTAIENVMIPGRIAGLPGRELARRAQGLLDQVGLAERASHFPSQLSGGEQQRVALCRALLLDPPILLADEPTGSLDPAAGAAVVDLLEELQSGRGMTAVVVTHNPALARRCDRILTLDGGALHLESA